VLARYSIRELMHRPLRTLMALLGVSVATAMLVDMLMLGGGIQQSFAELLEARGYELRVSPKGTLPFDTEATIVSFGGLRDTLEATSEIVGVAPVLASAVILESVTGRPAGRDGSGTVRAFALGIDPDEQGILRLVDGRLPQSNEALLDAPTSEALGIGLDDTVDVRVEGGLGVGGQSARMRISGIAEFLYAAQDESPIAMRLGDLQRLSGRPDAVSFAMVRLADDADAEAVRASVLREVRRVELVTVAGLVAQANERLSYFRQLALILGSVSLIVTSLLVGTIMAVSINERLGTIAALRAIGISRSSIVGGLAAESLILCALGGATGLGLGVVVAGYLESILSDFPGLPEAVDFFVLQSATLAKAYLMLLLVGVSAGLYPAWRATQLPVATTLHAEEP
jgi:putative ABC transport system permease protein